MGLRSLGVALLLLLLAASSCGRSGGESTSVRTAVIAGLVASGGGGITTSQAATFEGDIRSRWAIAYDPADPPGCTPGSLWGAPDGPPIPEQPCGCYVLVRRKSRWAVSASGRPGSLVPPEDAPADLGDPARLIYLAP